MTNLAGIVQEQAAQEAQGQRPALRQDGRELTYRAARAGQRPGRGAAARVRGAPR